MSKQKASAMVIPTDRIAKHWQEVYWPLCLSGLMIKDMDFELLSGNILEAILKDKLAILSFWWTDNGSSDMYAIALCTINRDEITGLRILQIHGFEKTKDIKPAMIIQGIAGLKKFMKAKRIARLTATVANKQWADILIRLEPDFKPVYGLTLGNIQ